MTRTYKPFGPFYLSLTCEADIGEQPRTLIIDGLDCEASAWRACNNLSDKTVTAITDAGETIEIDAGGILQVEIIKSAYADCSKAFRAA